MNIKYVVFSLTILTGASCWSAANNQASKKRKGSIDEATGLTGIIHPEDEGTPAAKRPPHNELQEHQTTIAPTETSCLAIANNPNKELGALAQLYASGASAEAGEIIIKLTPQDLKELKLIGIMKREQYPLLYEHASQLTEYFVQQAKQLVQEYDGDVQKAFFEAASYQPWALDYLIQQGARVNALDRHGLTALMLATTTGDIDAVTQLLAAGANINSVSPITGETALMIAGNHAGIDNRTREKIVNLLIANRARVNIASPINGETALTLTYNKNVIISLLEAGAHINHKNKSGKTALRKIWKNGGKSKLQKELIQALVDHGADIENLGPQLRKFGIKLLGE